MRTQRSKNQDREWPARRILDCGGNPAGAGAIPLSLTAPLEPKHRRLPRRRDLPAHSNTWGTPVALWVLVCSAVIASAQSYSIDWFTLDGGGGTSSGGGYSLSGTIGQPDANPQPLTGGNFLLVGGFWSLLAVQTPGGALLTIRLTTTNTALVLWPSPSTGFLLQQSTDLTTTGWVTTLETVSDNGVNKFISVNPAVGNRFYRLFKP